MRTSASRTSETITAVADELAAAAATAREKAELDQPLGDGPFAEAVKVAATDDRRPTEQLHRDVNRSRHRR